MEIGDVVRIKNGHVYMTVETLSRRDHGILFVNCMWFDKLDVLHRDTFKEELLVECSEEIKKSNEFMLDMHRRNIRSLTGW